MRIVAQINKVSIHASVKDATKVRDRNRIIAGFNPRICKRCDSGYRLCGLPY